MDENKQRRSAALSPDDQLQKAQNLVNHVKKDLEKSTKSFSEKSSKAEQAAKEATAAADKVRKDRDRLAEAESRRGAALANKQRSPEIGPTPDAAHRLIDAYRKELSDVHITAVMDSSTQSSIDGLLSGLMQGFQQLQLLTGGLQQQALAGMAATAQSVCPYSVPAPSSPTQRPAAPWRTIAATTVGA